MNEKQINKWLRRRFGTVGWVLTGYNVVLNVLVTAAMVVSALKLRMHGGIADPAAIMGGNGWGYLLAIGVGLVILNAWKGGDYWKQEILVKEKSMTFGVLFGTLSLTVAAQLMNSLWITLLEGIMQLFGKSAMPLLEMVSGSTDTVSMFLYGAILAPIAEEILFRGYVLRTLRPFGKKFAIFTSALLFGFFHGNLLQSPYAFLMGLVLGWVAAEYSLIWAVVLHMFNNLVLADLFTRLLNLLPVPAANMLDLGVLGAFTLVSVVLLIVKRREIGEYLRSERMDVRCLKCFFTSPGMLVFLVMMALNMVNMFFL